MAQSTGTVDSQPQMQKPMIAHLREESSELVDVNEKQVGGYISRNDASYANADRDPQLQTCAKTDTEAEPTLWMRGGGVIGDWYVSCHLLSIHSCCLITARLSACPGTETLYYRWRLTCQYSIDAIVCFECCKGCCDCCC